MDLIFVGTGKASGSIPGRGENPRWWIFIRSSCLGTSACCCSPHYCSPIRRPFGRWILAFYHNSAEAGRRHPHGRSLQHSPHGGRHPRFHWCFETRSGKNVPPADRWFPTEAADRRDGDHRTSRSRQFCHNSEVIGLTISRHACVGLCRTLLVKHCHFNYEFH